MGTVPWALPPHARNIWWRCGPIIPCCPIYPSNRIKGKPNPDGLNKIITLSKFKKKDAIFLGDTLYDYKASRKAKIDYLHANWGYQKILLQKVYKINNLKNIEKYLN